MQYIKCCKIKFGLKIAKNPLSICMKYSNVQNCHVGKNKRVCIKIGQNMTETFLEILAIFYLKILRKFGRKQLGPGKFKVFSGDFFFFTAGISKNFCCHSLSNFYTYTSRGKYMFLYVQNIHVVHLSKYKFFSGLIFF